MNFFCVAAALRDPQPALLCRAQFRRFRRGSAECGLGNIDNPIFLGVLPERDQFTDIAAGRFQRALPVIFGGGFLGPEAEDARKFL